MLRIGDEIYVHGYIDEIRKDTIIIRNDGGYFGTVPEEVQEGWIDTEKLWRTTRERTVNQALEIIDTAQTYKMFEGQEDTYIDKRVLREAVEALRGEQE